jgi:putative component of membrane protein insertase Oxa1/YidC/SpoIIIJ protein YidD
MKLFEAFDFSAKNLSPLASNYPMARKKILHCGPWRRTKFCTLTHGEEQNPSLWPMAQNKILHCGPWRRTKFSTVAHGAEQNSAL